MQAAIAYQPQGQVVLEEVDLARPGPNEVLVHLMASGVCHSDWHILKGEWGNALFQPVAWWSKTDRARPINQRTEFTLRFPTAAA